MRIPVGSVGALAEAAVDTTSRKPQANGRKCRRSRKEVEEAPRGRKADSRTRCDRTGMPHYIAAANVARILGFSVRMAGICSGGGAAARIQRMNVNSDTRLSR